MTLSPSKVVGGSGKPGGYAFRAPAGTALPTDASSALSQAFISQGLVSNEGVSRAIARAYEVIRDWNGDEVKRIKTETSVTITFALIEAANADVVKSVFGENNVTVNGNTIAVAFGGDEPPESVWTFELKDGNHSRRIVTPKAQIVTEDFTQEFTAGTTINFPVELTLFKDDNGKFFYDYSTDAATESSSSSSSSSSSN